MLAIYGWDRVVEHQAFVFTYVKTFQRQATILHQLCIATLTLFDAYCIWTT